MLCKLHCRSGDCYAGVQISRTCRRANSLTQLVCGSYTVVHGYLLEGGGTVGGGVQVLG